MRFALVLALVAACRGGADEPPPDLARAPHARVTVVPDAAPACRPKALPCEKAITAPDRDIDYVERYEYTPAGDVAVDHELAVGSARAFAVVTNTYDPQGRKIRVDSRDSNDKLTFVEHDEYRGADRDPSVVRMDTDGDGKIDKIEHHRYHRDGDLHIDDTDDGRFKTRYEKRFDAAGHLISYGQFAIGYPRRPGDKANEYQYDEHGYLTRETQWQHDGTPDYWTQSNQYDACGNLVRHDDDWHTDGTIDETSTYRYDCADGH